jgi:aconitate hydratase
LRVATVNHDPVTTTDELIPTGETSSYRSNQQGLAEFTLSRKDPAYVGKAKAVRAVEEIRRTNQCPLKENPDFSAAFKTIKQTYPDLKARETGIGSTIYAVKPGDGSAREQAASCQKVLGGWANIAKGYATKRYRSNLINWGMLPFLLDMDDDKLPFDTDDFIFIPGIRQAVIDKAEEITAYVVKDTLIPFTVKLGELTDDERKIILAGCLINYYKEN